jgi:hypothetical protein
MRRADLGISQSGDKLLHSRDLTELEAAVVDALGIYCQRPDAWMPADRLADFIGIPMRDLRRLINHLIDPDFHGVNIAPKPGHGGGYRLVTDPAEAAQAAAIHWRRVQTGVEKARALGARSEELAEGMAQLTLGLGGGAPEQVAQKLARAGVKTPPTHNQVKGVLARYAGNPRKYARQIAEISREFGGVFVRREELARVLRQQAGRFVDSAIEQITKRSADG